MRRRSAEGRVVNGSQDDDTHCVFSREQLIEIPQAEKGVSMHTEVFDVVESI